MKLILGIIVIALMSCGGEKSTNAPASTSAPSEKTAAKPANSSSPKATASTSTNRKGRLVYKQYCVTCHGVDGKLNVSGAKDLSISTIDRQEAINQVTNGKGLMTPYKDILSEEQILAVTEYIEELRQ